jgi:adenine-specific DNA-methyltransferase
MNKADGGNRKFILVEMEDYAESITAERVKRVINGYSNVEGTGGDFSFYDLGEPLLIGDNINESVGTDIIREYIWFTETKTPVQKADESSNPYYLGSCNDTAYYFYYEKDKITTLDFDFIATIAEKDGHYLIYADKCALSAEELSKYNITFKKIPRDIAKL